MDTNPEIDQDRVEDTVDHFRKFGYVMFPQQVTIYENIAARVIGKRVIEFGCGNGLGTAIIERSARDGSGGGVIGTDKLKDNVKFATCLYPWITFWKMDLNEELISAVRCASNQVSVCIETIEHVAHPQRAIQNLIDAAAEEVWISTPNGRGKERPPSNPYHVCEYTPVEIDTMLCNCDPPIESMQILHWKTFEPLTLGTDVDPLVYRIKL